MSHGSPSPEGAAEDAGTDAPPRRPTRADVFGDVLPDTTRDESGPPGAEQLADWDDDLLRNVPPHHG